MGSNILVVDDEPDVAAAWGKALRLAGHNPSTATSPAAALELARKLPLDVVVLDYLMPAMTGLALLNEIRKIHPFVRSVVISGKVDSTLSEKQVLSGIQADIAADIYLHKPVENSRLVSTVEELSNEKPESDWKVVASTMVNAPVKKSRVRTAERKLNQQKPKRR